MCTGMCPRVSFAVRGAVWVCVALRVRPHVVRAAAYSSDFLPHVRRIDVSCSLPALLLFPPRCAPPSAAFLHSPHSIIGLSPLSTTATEDVGDVNRPRTMNTTEERGVGTLRATFRNRHLTTWASADGIISGARKSTQPAT